jgi:two-component system response regulator DesR
MIRVLIAEDMRILRDALVELLTLETGIDVVAEVASGDAIVPAALESRPDVAVVDIVLPGLDGLTATGLLREQLPQCRVLILTALSRPADLRKALRAGAAGFLVKDAPKSEFVAAVRTVAAGGRAVDPDLALAALTVADNPLTTREEEIPRRTQSGEGLPEIADQLSLAVGTVRNYLASAVTELGARNRADAVRVATEAGWLRGSSPATARSPERRP